MPQHAERCVVFQRDIFRLESIEEWYWIEPVESGLLIGQAGIGGTPVRLCWHTTALFASTPLDLSQVISSIEQILRPQTRCVTQCHDAAV
jgi:hypothetical protein